MRTVLVTILLLVSSMSVSAQRYFDLNDKTFYSLDITWSGMIHFGSIRYMNLAVDRSKTQYVGKLRFGKRMFNLDVTDVKTGLPAFGVLPQFPPSIYFQYDGVKSTPNQEIYSLTWRYGHTEENYAVVVNKSTGRISIGYNKSLDGGKTYSELFTGEAATQTSVMEMEDDLSATFVLDHTSSLRFQQIEYSDPAVTQGRYVANLKFGKRRFDIAFFDKSTGKVIGGVYPLFRDSEYFTRDLSEKNEEVYTLTTIDGSRITDYYVRFNPANKTVFAYFRVTTDSRKTYKEGYVGYGVYER
jgi:hypothetical protein